MIYFRLLLTKKTQVLTEKTNRQQIVQTQQTFVDASGQQFVMMLEYNLPQKVVQHYSPPVGQEDMDSYEDVVDAFTMDQ